MRLNYFFVTNNNVDLNGVTFARKREMVKYVWSQSFP